MHLSFRVVLAAIAALTVSMAVSANTECYPSGHLCNSKAECCSGYNCVPVLDPQVDEHYSLTTKIDVRHNEPRRLLVDGNFTQKSDSTRQPPDSLLRVKFLGWNPTKNNITPRERLGFPDHHCRSPDIRFCVLR
ncbi:hypothetical protein EDD22DRAFT_853526 [Suillus occidentalis]|nr:hypothetical protein EDD22DRAFT_853526 [Suillus occidentalis]